MAGVQWTVREVRGRLLPLKDLAEEDDDYLKEDAEEDDDPGFVDAEELCSGGLRAGGLPGRQRVMILDENTQEQCKVFGRFPMMDPWWRVKLQVKPVGSRKCYHVQGFPSYFLLSDMSPPDQKQICSLFLKECAIPDDIKMKFLDWVDEVSSFNDLNFENLNETFRTFLKNGRNDKKQSTQNEREESLPGNETSLSLENKIPFINVMRALQFPKVMEFLPVLLPRHFKQLISSGSQEVLGKIEEILRTHPWKLGFHKITFRELKLLRCEASWAAFCQCKSLFRLMNSFEKNGLIMYSELKRQCKEHGHTYVEEADLTSLLSDRMSVDDAWQSLRFLKDVGVVTYEKACVFLYDLYEAERGIASAICHLMTRPPWHLHVDVRELLGSMQTKGAGSSGGDDTLKESKADETGLENSLAILDTQDSGDHTGDNGEHEVHAEESEVQLDLDQVAALEMICSNAVTVMSGKGGCGKTTIVSHLFKHVELLEESEAERVCEDFKRDQDVSEEWLNSPGQRQPEADKAIKVLLTAPTGKAAGLLRQRTDFSAYTLYQVNYSFYSWKTKTAQDTPWKFSSVRVLVVDEGSLVSVGIFKSVLKLLCEHARLSKLIILGDVRQLPSIEPGNLLQDLFETLKPRKCAIELRTNHRAESELIVDNATRISRRQFPRFDAELNLSDNATFPVSIQDKTFVFVRLPEEDDSSQLSKDDHRAHLYSAVRTLLKEDDLRDAEKSQFIAFRRQDCDVINDCCCRHYTDHLMKDHQKRLQFGVGDKICCTRNAYLSDLLPADTLNSQQNNDFAPSGADFNGTPAGFANKHDFDSGIRLCNGEIFFITKDVTDVTFGRRRLVTIDNRAGLEVTVDFQKLMKHCHVKHAWARTIHTFQGSEERTVVYVVGKAGRQHWQHVYTAVTRGRCRVYVIAEESQLRSAISRNSFRRRTRLKHFLQNNLSMSYASPADFASPSKSSGDSGGHSTQPSASPGPTVTADLGTNDVPRSKASAADGGAFSSPRRWKFSSPEDVDMDEDLSTSRGCKRTCAMDNTESPNKVLMVDETSPQVSSRLQTLKLNSLTPRRLFKSTDNQET
ncbi:DNA helicase B [Equus asinus]|uniref:DNA helicase B n=1 Tax=Equus asinus TaxID=9793 RepID=UPI00071A3D49